MYIPSFFRQFPALLLAISTLAACRIPSPVLENPPSQTESSSVDSSDFLSDFSSDFLGDSSSDSSSNPPAPPGSEHPPELDSSVFWDVTDVDISYVNPNKKLIAFTFDDAPSKTLESVLAVFAAYNQTSPTCKATATLFCNGIRINAASKQLLSAAHALKFELGNHSHSHADLTTLSNFDLQWETDATDALLYQIDGKSRHLFRAPFGKINEHVRSYAHTPIIDWTIDTLDWTNATAEEIYERVWSQKFSGAIVLMHDGYPSTVEALKRLLPDLRDAGYQAVSVSAMAKAHECPLRRGGVYIRARKKRG